MPTGTPTDPFLGFFFQIIGSVLLAVVTSVLPVVFDSLLTPLIEAIMTAFGITP